MRPTSRLGTLIVILATGLAAALTLWPLDDTEFSSPPWCVICDADYIPGFLLNMVLFLPLGVGLRLRGVALRRALLWMAALTIGVELLQFNVVPGRDASLGDILANLLGGWAGHRLGQRWLSASGRGS
jgi:glycopeptide antibiotics resistance protein